MIISSSNYTDTEIEYNIAAIRLTQLENEKEALIHKYCGVRSPNLTEPLSAAAKGNSTDSKVIAYIQALDKKRPSGLSLDEEIEEQKALCDELLNSLIEMAKLLACLKGDTERLYKYIAVDRIPITRAVEKVAEETDRAVSSVWRTNYKKIEKYVKNLPNRM